MRFKPFYGHLGAALACVAAFHFAWREVTYKLADSVLVYADRAGFLEMARERPFGAIDWLVRILAATNIAWWGIVVQLALVAAASTVAYLALRRNDSKLAPLAPWLAAAVFILPTLALGEDVWMLRHAQFPQMHLVWFMILSACLFAGRNGLVGFVATPFALVAVGKLLFHDLSGHESIWSSCNLPIVAEWDAQSLAVVSILILLASSAFVRRDLPRWMHCAAPAVFAIAFCIARPGRDTRDQLAMERAVRESRFADVLEVAPDKGCPERMETAWRILAMFRTECLDRDLFRYPMIGSHHDTGEPEMVMGAPLLMYNYGLILPARRWLFEMASMYGWKPQDYRMMGDIALVTGEFELARRYFDVVARCPFRGDYAARRMRLLAMPELPEGAIADLSEIYEMHCAWFKYSEESVRNRYTNFACDGERDVYALFQRLKSCPPKMFKMMLAASLLDGHPERVRENRAALNQLYPDGNIGHAFLQAFK